MSDVLSTPRFSRRRYLAAAGVLALSGCFAAWFFWPQAVLRGYLVAHQFWLGAALGSMALLMIYHLTGGRWGELLRRTFEAASLTLPLLAVLFVPVLLTLGDLYPWARPGVMAAEPEWRHKTAYLNTGFFVGRTVAYYAIWIVLAWRLRVWSRRQDVDDNPRSAARLARLSGPGLILYGLTVTFASTDWLMSLQPDWFSTIYCMVYSMLQLVSAMALGVATLVALRHSAVMERALTPEQLGRLGNFLLALVMLWAYAAFSEWMITWTGNLPEEIAGYLPRLEKGWEWVGVAIIGLQFGMPFLVLLSSGVKRRARRLAAVAYFVLCMGIVNGFYQVAPFFKPSEIQARWPDAIATGAAVLGIGGLWMAWFLGRLSAAPLLVQDNPLPEDS